VISEELWVDISLSDTDLVMQRCKLMLMFQNWKVKSFQKRTEPL